MISGLDCVALKAALPEHGLAAGDVGKVFHVCKDGPNFTAEFAT